MVEFDPFDYGFHRDPYPTYAWLREEAPLYHNERMDFWALSRSGAFANPSETRRTQPS